MLKKIFLLVIFCLSVALALSCSNVYKPGETNPFIIDDPAPLSGTVFEDDEGEITVELNPILISGEPLTDLPPESIWVWIGPGEDETKYTPVEDTLEPGSERPIDVAIILDNTSSMGPAIDGVKNSITSFASSLESAGINVRFALVTFGDSSLHPTPPGYITSEGFTDCQYERPVMDFGTAADLLNVINTQVTTDEGGDIPENPLDALLWGYNNLNWRLTSLKVFIVITDTYAHEQGDGSAYDHCTTNIDNVWRTLYGNAMVHCISRNYKYTVAPYGDIRQLADGLGEGRTTPTANTGGKWIEFPIDGNVDLSELGLESILTAGYTVVFDPEDPTRPLYILIQVDTDGDGVPDAEYTFTLTS